MGSCEGEEKGKSSRSIAYRSTPAVSGYLSVRVSGIYICMYIACSCTSTIRSPVIVYLVYFDNPVTPFAILPKLASAWDTRFQLRIACQLHLFGTNREEACLISFIVRHIKDI